ncbi:MAG: PD-(D/E)XK nuclease family protein [Bacteroidetes bacterium]|nr:PD-(D/E)XK nuclease family protein [Bacteroidota bacterium]
MNPFLKQVAQHLFNQYDKTINKQCIVLPSKRASLFLKQHLANEYKETIWLPTIISTEDLIEELSELTILNEIDLVCHLYSSYKECYGEGAETFDAFLKWGHLILQDFNEIDRYLADSKQLYDNLQHIKEIENWSLGETELSEIQLNYLRFMQSLGKIYDHFNDYLLQNKWAYQGKAYKKAVDNLSHTNLFNKYEKFIFCGFNALNSSEIKILKHLQNKGIAEFIWDADDYYLNNTIQEAGLFLRENQKIFGYFNTTFITSGFKNNKTLNFISVPKQIGQAQVVKQELEALINKGVNINKIAIVLANEKLLWPVLNQLPINIQHVNITMEYPLKYTSAYNLLDIIINLQVALKRNKYKGNIYYKDFLAFISHPLMVDFLQSLNINSNQIKAEIQNRNLAFLNFKTLKQLFNSSYKIIEGFITLNSNIIEFNAQLINLINKLTSLLSEKKQSSNLKLELEYLYKIKLHLNRISDVLTKHNSFSDIISYKQIFQQIVGASSTPFIGEPLQGLQIMGVLETRTLDFENIIFVNVNEGVLPSSKNTNSFLPNDLKRAFGLPLYTEKAAIYAYHFYRLLQRVNFATITYDSVTDTFGKGEKSRFITQMQLELKNYSNEIIINNSVAENVLNTDELKNNISIIKTPENTQNIITKATTNNKYAGLSASAINTYSDCALKFYFKYGANIKETETVEEYAESNTQGQITHLTLENLYKPFINQSLTLDVFNLIKQNIDSEINKSFNFYFDNKQLLGKNILQKEVVTAHVNNQIKSDINILKQNPNNPPVLLGCEYNLESFVTINTNNTTYKVIIKGTIDRLQKNGNFFTVIDYKNSTRENDKFEICEDLNSLFIETTYHKQFQLILYAWLLFKNNFCLAEQIQPCIIAFKSKTKSINYITENKQNYKFTSSFFNAFEEILIGKITEILNFNGSFEQTTTLETCAFCSYNGICNKI